MSTSPNPAPPSEPLPTEGENRIVDAIAYYEFGPNYLAADRDAAHQRLKELCAAQAQEATAALRRDLDDARGVIEADQHAMAQASEMISSLQQQLKERETPPEGFASWGAYHADAEKVVASQRRTLTSQSAQLKRLGDALAARAESDRLWDAYNEGCGKPDSEPLTVTCAQAIAAQKTADTLWEAALSAPDSKEQP